MCDEFMQITRYTCGCTEVNSVTYTACKEAEQSNHKCAVCNYIWMDEQTSSSKCRDCA